MTVFDHVLLKVFKIVIILMTLVLLTCFLWSEIAFISEFGCDVMQILGTEKVALCLQALSFTMFDNFP